MHESACLGWQLRAEGMRQSGFQTTQEEYHSGADSSASPQQIIITIIILSKELQDLCTHESSTEIHVMEMMWLNLTFTTFIGGSSTGWFHFIKFSIVSNYIANADGG